MLKNIKGISAIVSIMLLILVSTIAYIYLQNWYLGVDSRLKTQISSKNLDTRVEVRKIDGTLLTIKNDFSDDLVIKSVKIAGKECLIRDYIIDKGIATIDIGACSKGLSEVTPYSVMIITDFGMVDSYRALSNPVESDFIASFQFGLCDFANGYIRLYGLTDLDNAHVDIDGSSTYNVCVKHLVYNVSTSGKSFSSNLFYLYPDYNSAIWTQIGSRYTGEPPFWYNVSLSADVPIDVVINSSNMSDLDYTCVGKVDEDNIYGSHIGSCLSTMPDTIWVKVG